MKKTLIIGSTVVDVILNLPHLPVCSEDINIEAQHMQVGGCAFNVAHLLHQFKLPFTLFSPIGNGIYGDFIRKKILPYQMDLPLVQVDGENGACYCLVQKDGERSFLSYHGAEYIYKREWFSMLDETQYDSAYVCGLEIEEDSGEYIIEYLQSHPMQDVYFAPGPRICHIRKDLLERLFSLSVMLHMNEQEAREYTKASSLSEMAEVLYQKTHNAIMITLGARGAYVYDKGEGYIIGSDCVDVVDTIGAGDAHIASIIMARKHGKSLRDAITIANKIAAYVTTCKGSLLYDTYIQELSKLF